MDILDSIIEKCNEFSIPITVDLSPYGTVAYRISGFSKSGEALIYSRYDDLCVVCETRYGQQDDLLTFYDLAYVAHDWFLKYRDREPFTKAEPYWEKVFEELRIGKRNDPDDLDIKYEDLPF